MRENITPSPIVQSFDYISKIRPGDIVTCLVPPRLAHIMIVSDLQAANGTYLVIHNIGSGTREENRLKEFA